MAAYSALGRTMLRMRFITTLVVALSVALLPFVSNMVMASSIAVPSKLVQASTSHDCCDPDDAPLGNPMADCQAAAGCTSKCFSLYGPLGSGIGFQPALPEIEPSSISEPLHSRAAAPPFRPPRI